MMSPFRKNAAGGARVTKHLCGVRHRGRANDEKIDISTAFQDRRAGRGAQLILGHARPRAFDHRIHGVFAELAGASDAVEFFGAVHREQLVHPALREHELGARQALAQRVVLIDRQIVFVARVDFEEADTAALERQFLDAIDHHGGVLPATAAPHVRERSRRDTPHGLGMCAAHRVDQRRLALERYDHVAA